jgi:hypothetical protein
MSLSRWRLRAIASDASDMGFSYAKTSVVADNLKRNTFIWRLAWLFGGRKNYLGRALIII